MPDGTGSPLASSFSAGGYPADARVTVRLVDIYGAVVPLFPPEDMWLSCESDQVQCCGRMGFLADEASDLDGMVVFRVPALGI